MFILTLIYSLPLFSVQSFQKNLRNIHGVKVYIIALVWAGVTYVMPLLCKIKEITFLDYTNVFLRFIYILLLMLPFELRDLKNDDPNLGTIPQLLGVRNTKILALLMGAILVIANILLKSHNTILFVEVVMVILTTTSSLIYANNQPRFYTSFFVEGIPILWLLTLLTL